MASAENILVRNMENPDAENVAQGKLDTDNVISPVKNHGFNMFENIAKASATDGKTVVDGLLLMEPIQLYNILMQMEHYPCVSDPSYLLLLGEHLSNQSLKKHLIK